MSLNFITDKTLKRNRLFRLMWKIILFGSAFILFLFLLASWGAFGKLPTFKDLENPNLEVATEIYSSDGELIGKIYRKNRVNVSFEDLPPILVNSIISTEDERFFNHAGIDVKSTIRAFAFLGSKGGGSTITQQLAKNLLKQGRGNRNLSGRIQRVSEKLKEYIVALKLEKRYTKEEIIAMYLNEFDFVNNAIGIQSASKIYFSKDVSELDTIESAVIAGMLQNPSALNPKQNPNDSKTRRDLVFHQLKRNDFLTKTERDSLKQIETILKFNRDDHNQGLAPYLRSEIQNNFLPKWVKNNPKVDGGTYDIYRDGLKVYTTIDSRMQAIAENAVNEHLIELQESFDKQNIWGSENAKKALETAIVNSDRYFSLRRNHKSWNKEKIKEEMTKPRKMTVYHPVKGQVDTLLSPIDSIKYHRGMLQSAFIVSDPKSGKVKAWVGGRNFRYFKYDHATAKRQVGSTFKPFLYSVAIESGWSPCYTIPNLPVEIVTPTGRVWAPKNSGGGDYDGRDITLKYGLAQSMNNISAQLIKDIGPRPVIRVAEHAGLKDIPEVYSISLGTTEQSVIDMNKAYSMFANEGVATSPLIITRIEDKNGNVLQEFNTEKATQVISPQTAYIMLQMMNGVVNYGTAQRIRWQFKIDSFVAGKTGTTDDNADAWFVGLTPQLMGVVWTGADDPAIHFPTRSGLGQGARSALPIWGKFFKEIYAKESEFGIQKNATFPVPANLNISMNCEEVLNNPIGISNGGTATGTGVPIANSNVGVTSTDGGVVKPIDEPDEFE